MNKKTIFILLFTIFFSIMFSTICLATGTISISSSNKTINVGDSFTITVGVNDAAGMVNVSSSSGCISLNKSSDFLDNSTMTITGKANSAGNATITVTPTDVTGYDKNPVTASKSVTITVKEKETNTSSTNNNNSNTNSNTTNQNSENKDNNTNDKKTEEPTFTSVNQAVYATGEVNVRSSYTTSSTSLGKLKKDEEVTRIGVGSNGWSKVKYNGATAYISSTYLTTTKPKEEKKEEKSTIKALKTLQIEEGMISPDFDPETTKYTITVGSDITKLNIEALPEDEKAKVQISGNEDLKLGENIIKIVVTAEDETARTYTITVTKEKQEQLKLSTLSIKGINLNPDFKSDVYEYKAEVDSDVTSLDIETETNLETATIEILGNEELVEGENTITIMLKSEDGNQNVTYQIIVEKMAKDTMLTQNIPEETDNSNMQYVIGGAALGGIVFLIIIILIIKKVRSNRDEDGLDFNYMNDMEQDDNNNIDNIEQEEQYVEMEDRYSKQRNKLYDVEKEMDFKNDEYEQESRPKGKRKGKHF